MSILCVLATAAMSMLYDKKAVEILFDTHWTSKGWRSPFVTAPSDLAYAISKGVMFPPALLAHDETLQRLRNLCDTISPSRLGDAFLVSLGSREPALRSALGSFAVARFRPAHQFDVHPAAPVGRTVPCRDCQLWLTPTEAQGEDLNVLNFERLKWGGVRHSKVFYQVFDLEQFLALTPRQPTGEDVAHFHRILATIRVLPPNATAGHFEKALSSVIPSNKSERRQLIEVLCLCGVLSYPGYHHYFDDTEPPKDRPYRDTDWGIPAMYWRAQDGYSTEHLQEYFPKYASQLATA
jgi:hypothetical protein